MDKLSKSMIEDMQDTALMKVVLEFLDAEICVARDALVECSFHDIYMHRATIKVAESLRNNIVRKFNTK